MLGSTVAGPLAVDGPGAHIRVAVIERDNSRDGAPPRGPEQGAASIEGRKLVIPDENPRGETAMRRRLDEWARATQGPNLGEPNGFSEDESQVSGEHVKVGEEDVLQARGMQLQGTRCVSPKASAFSPRIACGLFCRCRWSA